MNKTWVGSLYLTLASCIWGGMYVVVKIVVSVIPPLELVWLRYFVALIALVAVGLITKQNWRVRKRDFLLIIAIGVIGHAISIVAQETGTLLSTAQMGAMITSSTPAFMAIFAGLILKERISLKQGVSIALATVGVLLIIGVGNLEFSGMLGGSALLVAALTWALMSVLVKRVPNEYSQVAVIAYSILVALLLLTPFVLPRLPELDMTQLAQPRIWGGLLYLGIASTAGGFLLWNRGLQLLDVSGGGLFFFFQPLVGAFLGWILLGETIGAMFWAGAAFILIGLLLVITGKNNQSP
ncbi:DMT family transporter [Cohnella boryungensis]|uniref:DMT family transporter n=1 Tax=Cohnella boryungensis TaxID=768479 RepID=A0ABV8SIS0_9BACL